MKDHIKIREIWESLNRSCELAASAKRTVIRNHSRFVQETGARRMERNTEADYDFPPKSA